MKTTKILISICVVLFLTTIKMTAQVTIGSQNAPNASAVLDLQTTNKGLLLPRVALTSTTAATPLSAHVAGMTVYNTATTGDVVPGQYYNDGTKWSKVSEQMYRLSTVTVDESATENISTGVYKTLQRAYDIESQKIFNQVEAGAVKFVCKGNVGGLSARGTIPHIELNGIAGSTIGNLVFTNTTCSLSGEVKISFINCVYSYLFLLSGVKATVTNSCNFSNSLFAGSAVAYTFDVGGVLAINASSSLSFAQADITAASIIVENNSAFNVSSGTITTTVGGIYVSKLSSFTIDKLNCNTNMLAVGNSLITLAGAATFLSDTGMAIGVSESSGFHAVGSSLTFNGTYSYIFSVSTGANIRLDNATVDATKKVSNTLVYADTYGCFSLVNDANIKANVNWRGFFAHTDATIILASSKANTITGTGGSAYGGLIADGGNIKISNGSYTFNGFANAMYVSLGGYIRTMGTVSQGTSTKLSNYPTGVPFGTILQNGSVIYFYASQTAP